MQGSESTFFSTTSDLSHLTTSPIYGRIFNLFPSPIGITKIDDGTFYDVNDEFCRQTGFSREEVIGKTSTQLGFWPDDNRDKTVAALLRDGRYRNMQVNHRIKDGTVKKCINFAEMLTIGAECYAMTIFHDITHQKKAEQDLNRLTRSLEEANAALRVLMDSKDHDQKTMQDKLKANINDLVIPYLKKLKKSGLDNFQKKCLSELENNLSDVLSPFLTNFLSAHQNLTPHEIQIADLIRRGKGTKEIADILNASANTIATHRNNIRKKLNLRNAKINLRSHLQSLS